MTTRRKKNKDIYPHRTEKNIRERKFDRDNGISLYPGLDNTPDENLLLLAKAARAGIRRVFTSLHIPETNVEALKKELGLLLKAARHRRMEVISDVSPATLKLLDLPEFNPTAFRMLGITTLRLDYGFTAEDIASLTHRFPEMRFQLNASTITHRLLQDLKDAGTDFARIDALHNFYPRRGTGLSEPALVHANILLHRYGIRVGAFVPSQDGRRRSPLKDGLPTLEEHRDEAADLSARHLVALGCDSVVLSDSLPTDEEITALGQLQGDKITLRAHLMTKDPVQKKLLAHAFTSRLDEARDAIRAQESRPLLKEMKAVILPDNTTMRPIGAITIDNRDYGRYMGELQIIRTPQNADARTNVAAMIDKSECNLLQYITPGRKFSFQFDTETDII